MTFKVNCKVDLGGEEDITTRFRGICRNTGIHVISHEVIYHVGRAAIWPIDGSREQEITKGEPLWHELQV